MKDEIFSETLKTAFCSQLRFLRNQRGISAREMSLSLGQNVNYINLIENGKRLPSMEGFFLICEYFGVAPGDFFLASQSVEPAPAGNSQAQEEVLATVSRLDNRQCKFLVDFLESIIP